MFTLAFQLNRPPKYHEILMFLYHWKDAKNNARRSQNSIGLFVLVNDITVDHHKDYEQVLCHRCLVFSEANIKISQ